MKFENFLFPNKNIIRIKLKYIVLNISELLLTFIFHTKYTCSVCILTSLRLNYVQISNKHRI